MLDLASEDPLLGTCQLQSVVFRLAGCEVRHHPQLTLQSILLRLSSKKHQHNTVSNVNASQPRLSMYDDSLCLPSSLVVASR